MTQRTQAVNRRRGQWRSAIRVFALAAGAVSLLIWGSQPRWRTCILSIDPGSKVAPGSKVDPKARVAVAIDYPDGWAPTVTRFGDDSVFLGQATFKPQEPTGVALWWKTYILRQKPSWSFPRTLTVTLSRHSNPVDLASEEQHWKGISNLFKNLTVARTNQALGPALEIRGDVGPPVNGSSLIRFHQLIIYPRTPGLPLGCSLRFNESGPIELLADSGSRYYEMAHRLRVVEAPVVPGK